MDFNAKERAERPVSFRVIVPAWQVAEYLGEALESVRVQPFERWMCHVVDDGSVDRTGTIADAFCRKDARFRVTHQRNAGASAARNRALPEHGAEGEYLVFLDADDTLAPDCFEWMSEAIRQNHPGYLEWGAKEQHLIGRAMLEYFVRTKILYGFLWRGIFRTQVVEGIRFQQGLCMCEDMLWLAQVARRIDTGLCMRQKGYHYRKRPGQATARRTRRSYACQLEAYGKAYRAYLADPRMDEALRRTLRRVVAHCIATETVAMAMYGESSPCASLRDFLRAFRQENLPLRGVKGWLTRLLAWPVLGEVTALALAGAGWMLRIRRGA